MSKINRRHSKKASAYNVRTSSKWFFKYSDMEYPMLTRSMIKKTIDGLARCTTNWSYVN